GEFMFFLPATLIVTLIASLIIAYIINPVFAVSFMTPHTEHEGGKPRFDRGVKRTLIGFAIVAALVYLIDVGSGNFVVFLAILYLLHHFVLAGVIKKFQQSTWPSFQKWYTNRLQWFLHRPWLTLGGTFLLLIVAIFFTVV